MFNDGKEIFDVLRARPTGVLHGSMSSPSAGRVASQSQGVPMAASGKDADKGMKVKSGGFAVFRRFCYQSMFATCLPLGIGKQNNPWQSQGLAIIGGETGIRTLGTVSRTHAFQACPFDHSGISPLDNLGSRQSQNAANNSPRSWKYSPHFRYLCQACFAKYHSPRLRKWSKKYVLLFSRSSTRERNQAAICTGD